MISYDEALAVVLDTATVLDEESLPLERALGRFLASEVRAPSDSPAFDDSAVDGYAVRSQDVPGTLRLVGTVFAGDDPGRLACGPGQCVKTMTGAGIASGADAVVMHEDVHTDGDTVTFRSPVKRHANLRKSGSEFKEGDTVIEKGARLTPASLGLLASLGLADAPTFRAPRIAIVVTGEELVPPGGRLGPGQKFESNSVALAQAAKCLTGEIPTVRIIGDDESKTTEALKPLLDSHDLLVTSGGASVGERDLVRPALARCGVEENFWRVAIKPGKPVAFGKALSGCLAFSLPGNPVSALVTFEVLVAPAIRKMQGAPDPAPKRETVTLATRLDRHPGRLEFVRATTRIHDGKITATPVDRQGSNMMTSLTRADRLLVIQSEVTSIEPGAIVESIPFRWPER